MNEFISHFQDGILIVLSNLLIYKKNDASKFVFSVDVVRCMFGIIDLV